MAPLFDPRTWRQVQHLRVGVILAPDQRTISSALYHHILNRAIWSSLAVSQVLRGLLVPYLVSARDPIRLGIDETRERRWGPQIAALGVYQDPVRSSRGHFVKAKGLSGICLMLRVDVPWAARVWALPFPTVLAPSRRYYAAQGRGHKTIDGARPMLCVGPHGWSDRTLVVIGDRTYATLQLLATCQRMLPPLTFLTRRRLDALRHALPSCRPPGQKGRSRRVGSRLPSLPTVLTDGNAGGSVPWPSPGGLSPRVQGKQ